MNDVLFVLGMAASISLLPFVVVGIIIAFKDK